MDRDTRTPAREETASERPADTLRDTNLKATIWRNEGDERPFYAASFARAYKDEKGEYRDADTFVGTDLLKLSELARKAYDRTTELRREDREAAREAFKERRLKDSDKDREVKYER